jgi:hypothetical protein
VLAARADEKSRWLAAGATSQRRTTHASVARINVRGIDASTCALRTRILR